MGTAIDHDVHGPTEAPGVVMTHGGGLNRAMFEPQLPALGDDFRVVTWDLPGHGRSAPLDANLDVPTVADRMIAIMDAQNIAQAVTVGHSLGSFVVQHAALRRPDRVSAIVSVGGMPIDEPMGGLELFRQPLLITHGEHEMPKSLVEANRRWQAAVPGSRYAEVPDAGHNATMDNPEAFNEVLLAFLRDVTRTDRTASA